MKNQTGIKAFDFAERDVRIEKIVPAGEKRSHGYFCDLSKEYFNISRCYGSKTFQFWSLKNLKNRLEKFVVTEEEYYKTISNRKNTYNPF